MTVLSADQFNRADANPIGAPWVTITSQSNMALVSNAATPASLASDVGVYRTGTFPANQYSQARITVTGTTTGTGPCLHVRASTSANTHYRLACNHKSTLNLQLNRVVTGTFTSMWNRTAAFTDGDLIRLEAVGSILRVFINGVQVGADFTDGSPIASGQPGIGYSGSTTVAIIDDWSAGDFGQFVIVNQQSLVRAHYW